MNTCRSALKLARLYEAQAVHGAVPAAEMAAFRRASAEALAPLSNHVASFPSSLADDAEFADEPVYAYICLDRTAIQSMLDDYHGTAIDGMIDLAEVAHLDDMLRELALVQGPVPEARIPQGIPESHWWWRYPPPELIPPGRPDFETEWYRYLDEQHTGPPKKAG